MSVLIIFTCLHFHYDSVLFSSTHLFPLSLLLLSALLDQLADRHEGLLEAKSLQGTAGLNLPQPLAVTGQIQLVGDLWGRRGEVVQV